MPNTGPVEVDWERLDKRKFLVLGTGLFSGVTCLLYPMSVIKTRQMANEGVSGGFQGAKQVTTELWAAEGLRGFYKGMGTVIFGTLPARVVYMGTLEVMKDATNRVTRRLDLSDSFRASLCNFVGGASASLATQTVTVPIDVISQRLMVQSSVGDHGPSSANSQNPSSSSSDKQSKSSGGALRNLNGFQMARTVVQQDGVRGLYRGFGTSIATYVPSSAMWWGSYGGYQKLIWHHVDSSMDNPRSTAAVIAVQTTSSVLAGMTASIATNPMDLIKTRLQVGQGEAKPSFRQALKHILDTEGLPGLFRGVVPRMASNALWGTAMVSTYEFLKRICALPDVGS